MYEDKEDTIMSYEDEEIHKQVEQKPSDTELHNEVKADLESIREVI